MWLHFISHNIQLLLNAFEAYSRLLAASIIHKIIKKNIRYFAHLHQDWQINGGQIFPYLAIFSRQEPAVRSRFLINIR